MSTNWPSLLSCVPSPKTGARRRRLTVYLTWLLCGVLLFAAVFAPRVQAAPLFPVASQPTPTPTPPLLVPPALDATKPETVRGDMSRFRIVIYVDRLLPDNPQVNRQFLLNTSGNLEALASRFHLFVLQPQTNGSVSRIPVSPDSVTLDREQQTAILYISYAKMEPYRNGDKSPVKFDFGVDVFAADRVAGRFSPDPGLPLPPGTALKIAGYGTNVGDLPVPERPRTVVFGADLPKLAFSQPLLGGGNRGLVARLPLKAESPDLFARQIGSRGKLSVVGDAQISTEPRDKAAEANVVVSYKTFQPFARPARFAYHQLALETGVHTNEVLTNQSATFSLSYRFSPTYFPRLGNALVSTLGPAVEITPLVFQDWWRKDTRDSTGHGRDGLYYSRAQVSLTPIYLYPARWGKGHPSTNPFLEVAGTVYHFYNETAAFPGVEARPWEIAGSLRLVLPLRNGPASLKLKENPLGLCLTLARTINEAGNFERAGGGLRLELRSLPSRPPKQSARITDGNGTGGNR